MITAYKINKLLGLDVRALERAIQKNYPEDKFLESRFLGITNAKQFCYEVLYFDNNLGENCFTKVFVDLDTTENPIADY